MRRYLLFAILFVSIPNALMAQSPKNTKTIDKRIFKTIDVTGDEKPDIITLHLQAKNIKSPFSWSLIIVSEGEKIYSHVSDDTWLDQNFNDIGFVLDCEDYLSCKQKYYYHDILDQLVLTGGKGYNADGILDKTQSNTLYPLGRKQLKECCNINEIQADAILNRIEDKLRKGKAVVLSVLKSPVKAKPAMIFAPEVGRFLIIYEE